MNLLQDAVVEADPKDGYIVDVRDKAGVVVFSNSEDSRDTGCTCFHIYHSYDKNLGGAVFHQPKNKPYLFANSDPYVIQRCANSIFPTFIKLSGPYRSGTRVDQKAYPSLGFRIYDTTEGDPNGHLLRPNHITAPGKLQDASEGFNVGDSLRAEDGSVWVCSSNHIGDAAWAMIATGLEQIDLDDCPQYVLADGPMYKKAKPKPTLKNPQSRIEIIDCTVDGFFDLDRFDEVLLKNTSFQVGSLDELDCLIGRENVKLEGCTFEVVPYEDEDED